MPRIQGKRRKGLHRLYRPPHKPPPAGQNIAGGSNHEQQGTGNQASRSERHAPHGGGTERHDRECQGRTQALDGRTGRGYAGCRGLQSHLEGRHQQPHRHRRPEAGSPGTGPALHPDQHDPALRIGMKKAPNVTATRRGHPVHRHPGGYMNIISWPAR